MYALNHREGDSIASPSVSIDTLDAAIAEAKKRMGLPTTPRTGVIYIARTEDGKVLRRWSYGQYRGWQASAPEK
jgi:hypothetical protein